MNKNNQLIGKKCIIYYINSKEVTIGRLVDSDELNYYLYDDFKDVPIEVPKLNVKSIEPYTGGKHND